LQQKVIDGTELVYNNIPAGRFYEVLKYVSETKHILLVNFEVISTRFFNNLPVEYQQILVEECERAGIETSKKIMGELEAKAKQTLIENGMTIVEDVDLQAFKKAGEKAYEVLKLTEARDEIYKQLGKTKDW